MRKFIAICEKELELYYRHIALYSDPNDRDPKSILDPSNPKNGVNRTDSLTANAGIDDGELSDEEEEYSHYSDCEDDGMLSEDLTSSNESGDER